jgi:hypothetical protein
VRHGRLDLDPTPQRDRRKRLNVGVGFAERHERLDGAAVGAGCLVAAVEAHQPAQGADLGATSRRREVLTFNHHLEVTALDDPAEADRLLDWCEEPLHAGEKQPRLHPRPAAVLENEIPTKASRIAGLLLNRQKSIAPVRRKSLSPNPA